MLDRYKSIVTQDQNYLLELIRYVHLNPIRAAMCGNLTELKKYHWSGHRNLMLPSRHKGTYGTVSARIILLFNPDFDQDFARA